MMRRRAVMKGLSASAIAAGLPACGAKPPLPPGRIVGQAHAVGHLVRDGFKAAATREVTTRVAIIGAGVSGLSAARALKQGGIDDLLILELADQVGGNAASGANAVSAYPWGAHYLPLPGPELVELRAWLHEIGVIVNASGEPVYEERYLCRDPQERLHELGGWHEGLTPSVGLSADDHQQLQRFNERMTHYRKARGTDGKRAFTLPLDDSSADTEFRDLDALTMTAWLQREGFTSAAVHWLANYACRDDYGCRADQTSAWAGIHYFASRTGSAEGDVLTWPEGNGWLVRQLATPFTTQTRLQTLVTKITQTDGEVLIDCFNTAKQEAFRVRAKAAVFAGPRFVAARVVEGCAMPAHAYVLWMIANLTVRPLKEPEHTELCWDNVLHEGRGLGYVNAMHQQLAQHYPKQVLTYYMPLTDDDPKLAREVALKRTQAEWAELVLADLEPAHPDIREKVEQLDVWLWGHAMVRLAPGFIWGQRLALERRTGRVIHAHTDMSGISIFEEAFHQGLRAAQAVKEVLHA